MSQNVTVNGTVYAFPVNLETDWGTVVTNWAAAVSQHTLQKTGGTFTLTADVDFGTTYGLKSAYFKSRSSNIASAGIVRLANTDTVGWRNNANGADLPLGVDTSDRLTFNGLPIANTTAVTASRALASDASGVPVAATTTATELGYVNGVTSAIQTQLNTKITASSSDTLTNKTLTSPVINTPTGIVKGDVGLGNVDNTSDTTKNAASVTLTNKTIVPANNTITLASANILVGNVSNVAAAVSPTGDVTITNAGVTAIGSNKVTNAQLAQIATATFKGRTTAATGNVEDLTATQATALLNSMVGDSGSGGTKGLAPAPASGDAAANKYLKADGTWAALTALTDPMTTRGDVIVRNSSNATARLAIGTANKLLYSDGTDVSWHFLKGTTTNDSATAGDVGEYIENVNSGAANNMPATGVIGVDQNISLTAGDWNVSAVLTVLQNGATITVSPDMWIGPTSGNSSADRQLGVNYDNGLGTTGGGPSSSWTLKVANFRVSISGTTTYYLKGKISYSAGTPTYNHRISARRVR